MKMMAWLAKTILATAIVTGVSVATTWAVVNAYVQQLLGQYGMQGAAGPVGLMDTLTALGGGRGVQGEAAPASANVSPGEDDAAVETPSGTTPEEEYPVPDNALPVMGQATQSTGTEDELYISMDDLNEKKDNISDEDRMAIFAMLVTKLPPEEVQAISALLEDGFTGDEMEQASAILQQYLTPEEYAKLLEILQKY
ncbi:hypothetical protein FE782_28230 [Paenibacillus antri]|uniref:Spore coat protein n=1 Tax=Paenibacillus antri TaxID=2582848 RepID=A0A5R9FXW8_9BACL|nr:hypothetical protein [Paenibacillus antri]TLS48892.1 hypothetical protein FE782_28230 [Paenibacillus antri]